MRTRPMFNSITQTTTEGSRRTATLCSAAVHLAAVAALWAASQAITAPPIPRHEQRKAVLVVSPPPQLYRPQIRLKATVRRFEPERVVANRRAEPIRMEAQAPLVEGQTRPAPILPQHQEITVKRPAGRPAAFAEVARAAAPKLEMESRPTVFAVALGKLEMANVAQPGGEAGFGTAGMARAQSPTSAAGNGGFGAVEVGRAARRVDQSATAGFGAAERRALVGTTSEPVSRSSRSRAVKILWRPVPKYSDEAVRRRIEGDVVLLVRFLAQGRVETLQVVNGLGYGLDEYALQAAEAIRFEPATEDDRPVDYTAQVRIRFELAY